MLLAVIALIPGCCGVFRSKKAEKRPMPLKHTVAEIDIPVADTELFEKEFDLDELVLADQQLGVPLDADDSQYSWIESKNEQGFKEIYFDFDDHRIKSSERDAADYDIARMKEIIAREEKKGNRVQFVINGNADHAAGSDTYNRIKSNQRAKAFESYAISCGISRENIKSVGRGYDVPALVNGKPCTGNKDQQAPNRRDEIQIVVA